MGNYFHQAGIGTREGLARAPGVYRLTRRLVILTEIIAPYRIPVFNALAQRPEIELHIIFLSENDPTIRQWRVYKDEIRFQYEVLPSWRRRIAGYNLLLNRGVRSALNRIQPDVVLCGGYNYLASWRAANWAKGHGVPLLLWSESTAFDRRRRYSIIEFLKKRFIGMCAAFVVPGKSSQNYLSARGIPEDRIFIAPNAVDNSFYSKLAEGTRSDEAKVRARHGLPPRYFLYVGRLVRDKGVFELFDAYARVKSEIRSQVGLLLVGEGSDHDALAERASQIAIGSIQFRGFVHREELGEIYALADAFIFPTRSDPWGLVVNEAMACALPVIVSDVAGCAADLVRDGWNGFVVSPGAVSKLASEMTKLAEDPDLRREMGGRSRERIDAYSPATWAEGVAKAVMIAGAARR